MPASARPALFETMVRSLVPLRRTAAIRLSGTPQRPKPPIRIVAPSKSFSMAASAPLTRLSIAVPPKRASAKESLLQVAEKFVEFIGGVEIGFELPGGELVPE